MPTHGVIFVIFGGMTSEGLTKTYGAGGPLFPPRCRPGQEPLDTPGHSDTTGDAHVRFHTNRRYAPRGCGLYYFPLSGLSKIYSGRVIMRNALGLNIWQVGAAVL